MEERNPSPPREFQDEADKFRQDMVGETTISKRWLYSILMDMCKETEKQAGDEDVTLVDISNDLQDEMCRLWDLCIEEDVACFLADSEYIPLLCGTINKSKSPRLTEITVGILGNMACSPKACAKIAEYDQALSVITSLLSCRDTPTLTEVGRLISTSLVDPYSKEIWLDFFEVALPEFLEDITFILSSSSNDAVLRNMLEVVDACMDSRDNLLNHFVDKDFANAVAEAGLQLIKDDESSAGVITCLHVLYLLTTVDEKAESLFQSNSKIFKITLRCCEAWMKLDDFSIAEDNPSPIPLASCFYVLYFLLDVSFNSATDNFIENVSNSEKEVLCSISNIVLRHCKNELNKESKNGVKEPTEKSIPTANGSSETVSEKSELSPDEVTESSSAEIRSMSHCVPLVDITTELISVLVRLKWKT